VIAALMLMHVATAAVAVPIFARTLPDHHLTRLDLGAVAVTMLRPCVSARSSRGRAEGRPVDG
jgi:hypothetical protein